MPTLMHSRYNATLLCSAALASLLLAPAGSAAPPTRTEDQRLESSPWIFDGALLGSELAMSRQRLGGGSWALTSGPGTRPLIPGMPSYSFLDHWAYTPGAGWAHVYTDFLPLNEMGVPVTMFERDDAAMGLSISSPLPGNVVREHWLDGTSAYIVNNGIDGALTAIAASPDGSSFVVGRPWENHGRGQIQVYEAQPGTNSWQLKATFTGSAYQGSLGQSVAMNSNLIVAGAPAAGSNGAVYTFLRTPNGWIRWASISSPAVGQTLARFGSAVAVTQDGEWLAVGSPRLDRTIGLPGASPLVDVGAVYVYRTEALGFTYMQLLRPSGASSNDQFGSSVALHENLLVAGAPWEDHAAGAAYVFQRTGSKWQPTWRLASSSGGVEERLGQSVAVSDLGVLVGAPWADANGVHDQGAVLYYANVELDD